MKNKIKKYFYSLLVVLVVILFAYSFWKSTPWLHLCYGLALFIFGMQCMEEGLHNAAGGYLEEILARSTATPKKGLLFGMGATFLLQSSTLVSLLTIAFLSAGLIQLAGGISIILGANLGATSGIWLLALAGQNFSLSPIALPLLFFGVLASFFSTKTKAIGRVLLGIGLLFIGIDAIKEGFSDLGGHIDITSWHVSGAMEILVFFIIGLLLTVVLQSSHATLMLTLAALAGDQLTLYQGLAIAIGSNLGSSLSTAVVGILSSNRVGQRLSVAHLLFNTVTAVLALCLFTPLYWLVIKLSTLVGLGNNTLIQLALFHTLFNVMGVAIFWRHQKQLARLLERWLPDKTPREALFPEAKPVTEETKKKTKPEVVTARYLNDNALKSTDTSILAIYKELLHMEQLCLELIAHAIYTPVALLYQKEINQDELKQIHPPLKLDVEDLYQQHIKGVYSTFLTFISKLEVPLNDDQKDFVMKCQLAALQLVEAIKYSDHLQKNMQQYLFKESQPIGKFYFSLRKYLFEILFHFQNLLQDDTTKENWQQQLTALQEHSTKFETQFKSNIFEALKKNEITGWQVSSLMNDLVNTSRIIICLRDIAQMIYQEDPVIKPYMRAKAITQEPVAD